MYKMKSELDVLPKSTMSSTENSRSSLQVLWPLNMAAWTLKKVYSKLPAVVVGAQPGAHDTINRHAL